MIKKYAALSNRFHTSLKYIIHPEECASRTSADRNHHVNKQMTTPVASVEVELISTTKDEACKPLADIRESALETWMAKYVPQTHSVEYSASCSRKKGRTRFQRKLMIARTAVVPKACSKLLSQQAFSTSHSFPRMCGKSQAYGIRRDADESGTDCVSRYSAMPLDLRATVSRALKVAKVRRLLRKRENKSGKSSDRDLGAARHGCGR